MRTLWLTLRAAYLTQLPQNSKKRRDRLLARSLPNEGTEALGMKKGLITLVCLIALSVTAIPAGAQTRLRRYDQRYDQRVYSGRSYNNGTWYDNRSVWDRH